MKTSVCLIIFNRPQHTRRVLEHLLEIKPARLFVVADGPRVNVPEDLEKCAEVRDLVDQMTNWGGEVTKLYREENVGCGLGPATGINWVFSMVDRAIILEDDILPHPSFYQFCAELLELYADDDRILSIGGRNWMGKWNNHNKESYIFTHYPSFWGWATWRRAWKLFDFSMKEWKKKEVQKQISNYLSDKKQFQIRRDINDKTFSMLLDKHMAPHIWDHQWIFTHLYHQKLAIVPTVNLTENIGLGPEATHTVLPERKEDPVKIYSLGFPMYHPQKVETSRSFDHAVFWRRYYRRVQRKSLQYRTLIAIRQALDYLKRFYWFVFRICKKALAACGKRLLSYFKKTKRK